MKIIKIGFKNQEPDSVDHYLGLVLDIIRHSDEDAQVTFSKATTLKVHIYPSSLDIKSTLVEGLLTIHRKLHQKIQFSKSLAIAKTISYEVLI